MGILPLAFSLNHAGPLAWTTEDCAILLQAMAGHDPRDPASVSYSPPDYRTALQASLRGFALASSGISTSATMWPEPDFPGASHRLR
jgi:aspartyl-tRNA(Asn)/glutamyl-tRNA(Gln) amidotransferase subunit A